jgi:hypothetical protein
MMRTTVIGFALALLPALAACEGSDAPWTAEPSASTAQQLGAVRGCQSQLRRCLATATTAAASDACEQALRSCLSSIAGDAGDPFGSADGGPTGFPRGSSEGGAFPGHGDGGPGYGGGSGGGNCAGAHNDGGSAPPDDAGGQPPVDDAGGPPPPSADAAVTGTACLATLESCLRSNTPPATCASNAENCLQSAQ